MNRSKINSKRFWRIWHESGAVQAQNIPVPIKIDAVAENLAGPAKGYSTLSLGSQRVNESARKPTHYIVLPGINKYKPGQILTRIPGNAIPTEIMFP